MGLKVRKSYVRALRLANEALVLRIDAKRAFEERQRVATEKQKREAEDKAKEDAIKQAMKAKETEAELQKLQEVLLGHHVPTHPCRSASALPF